MSGYSSFKKWYLPRGQLRHSFLHIQVYLRCEVPGNKDMAKQLKVWQGKHFPTGQVSDAVNFQNPLGLDQPASQASQPGPAAAAAGPPAADGGGGIDAQVIELTRKISAMKAQVEQLEKRNAN